MRRRVLIIIAATGLVGLGMWLALRVKQQPHAPAANDMWLDQINISTDNPQQAGKNITR